MTLAVIRPFHQARHQVLEDHAVAVADDLRLRYGAVTALRGVSLELHRGEVLGVASVTVDTAASDAATAEFTMKVLVAYVGAIVVTGIMLSLLLTRGVIRPVRKAAGDIIEVPIDCNDIYGPRDESLVITDYIENVPEEYREVGMAILMENEQGATKTFLVTRIDDKSITIDGNNPLAG